MSASAHSPRPLSLNRRRRVRQRVHAPAYATFRRYPNTDSGNPDLANADLANTDLPNSSLLDLNEILDISEVGVAVQCAAPMPVDRQIELCLDLAESSGQIFTAARVIWSASDGRAGLALPPLPAPALHRLREWLFLNAMAGAANAAPSPALVSPSSVIPNYSDTLSAAAAVQREAESLGADLEAVLNLFAARSRSLLRASGAAIALADTHADVRENAGTVLAQVMTCRASAGLSAPPVGARLQVGSGFSGECVRTGTALCCDDTETDERVDAQTCRALGIRSMLAVPIRSGAKMMGLIEVFSGTRAAFHENDRTVLQRFAESIAAALLRAKSADDPPAAAAKPFVAPLGSVLFAHEPEDPDKEDPNKKLSDEDKVGGIHLPRAHLYLLICFAAVIFLVLGYVLAPAIQPWIQARLRAHDKSPEHTVLASSEAPQPVADPVPAVETATPAQLQELAEKGNPAAENALGLRYASGDGVPQDDNAAARWFTKAAESGNVKAQVALGTRYWAGRGVPASLTQAYFWTVLARAAGDKNSKTFAEFLASHMTRAQAATIEQQADIWYQRHESAAKPSPGR